MQVYEFSIALRFWHPSIDPQEITSELSMAPSHQCRAGEPRVTPKGTVLGGTRRESYWHADITGSEWRSSNDGDAEQFVFDLLSKLDAHESFLGSIVSSGGRGLIHINLHGQGNYALEFSPSLLAKCGALHLSLATEVYGTEQSGVA